MSAESFQRRETQGTIVIGYVATECGMDALRLGIALARGRDIKLEIVMVAPAHNSFSGTYPHDRGYESILEEQIARWLEEALSRVPESIKCTARIVPGESEASALNATAVELNADLLVVGARKGGIFGRFQMGAAVNMLLHSAAVPVALAPRGYQYPGPISRVTTCFGPRPGTSDVIAIGIDRAQRREVPLRLVSLVLSKESDMQGLGTDVPSAVDAYANRRLGTAAKNLVATGYASTTVASGKDVESALSSLDWQEGEIAVVGSSRMAVPGRLFLGSTAARMLRTIPVPMVVVPAGYMRTDDESSKTAQGGGE